MIQKSHKTTNYTFFDSLTSNGKQNQRLVPLYLYGEVEIQILSLLLWTDRGSFVPILALHS